MVGGDVSELRAQVGNLVRHHREVAGITQAALAEMTDRSVQLIGRIERGQSAPSFETLEAMAKALNVAVRDFFGAGIYAAGSRHETDPLNRLMSQVAALDQRDLEWITDLVMTALDRRSVRSSA